MDATFARRGFLPEPDPLRRFPAGSPLEQLDDLGRDLPSLLEDKNARLYLKELDIPRWPTDAMTPDDLPALRLCYVRLGFVASGYVNQVGVAPATTLPKNIALPLCHACKLLDRPPILSYDGYALYNWKRFDPAGPIALGNIDTIQNFIHLYDEHWFILVHVEIEALAAEVAGSNPSRGGGDEGQRRDGGDGIAQPGRGHGPQAGGGAAAHPGEDGPARLLPGVPAVHPVLRERGVRGGRADAGQLPRRDGRPEQRDPGAGVVHEDSPPADDADRPPGGHAAVHAAEHRELLAEIAAMPDPRPLAGKDAYNAVLEEMARFREVHFGWADLYIHQRVADPRGTGGTPYRQWLQQLVDETRAHMM